jgi:hypothetical protein
MTHGKLWSWGRSVKREDLATLRQRLTLWRMILVDGWTGLFVAFANQLDRHVGRRVG